MYDPIHWHTWNADGYRVRTSRTHAIRDDFPHVTACGKPVPPDGNGIETEGGESTEGWCRRCHQAILAADDGVTS